MYKEWLFALLGCMRSVFGTMIFQTIFTLLLQVAGFIDSISKGQSGTVDVELLCGNDIVHLLLQTQQSILGICCRHVLLRLVDFVLGEDAGIPALDGLIEVQQIIQLTTVGSPNSSKHVNNILKLSSQAKVRSKLFHKPRSESHTARYFHYQDRFLTVGQATRVLASPLSDLIEMLPVSKTFSLQKL